MTDILGPSMPVSFYQRRFYIDLIIAIILGIILATAFFVTDAVDSWYEYTRAHEDWELDEFAGIFIAAMIAATYFSVRASITFLRINKALDEANKTISEQMTFQARQDKLMSLGQLSGGMAHEINNALQPMLGITQVARRRLKDKDPELYDALGVIEDSANHAAQIVANVLEFSKKSKNENMKIHHAGALIKRSTDFAATLLPETIRLHYMDGYEPERIGETVHADETNMKQIFINLFKNAAEAMNGKGDITIRCHVDTPTDKLLIAQDLPAGQYMIIEVSDNGAGIEPKILQQIFDPFFTTKREFMSEKDEGGQYMGTGLGLSTVYGLLRQHGGTITAHNVRGKGACFTVYLPII